ncbi:MAG: hypothetical protein KY397_04315 [Gemmatimonadetes bacterium]|nr:hypothetical protein [Gemmatimonadota bacterium]
MNVYVREYQKIERRARRRDSFALRYLPIVLALAGAVVVGKIYLQSVAIEWSHGVIAKMEAVRDLEVANEELRRSIASLTTRERIAREAADRLGMVTPTETDVVWLPVLDRSSRQAAPAPEAMPAPGPAARVAGWLDALWQEEALALTTP